MDNQNAAQKAAESRVSTDEQAGNQNISLPVPPGFMLYREVAYMFFGLSDAEAGQVIKAALKFFLYGKTEKPSGLSDVGADTYNKMLEFIGKSLEEYAKKVTANRRNGKLGGRPRKT